MLEVLGRFIDALFEAAVKLKLGIAISAILYLAAGTALAVVSALLSWSEGHFLGLVVTGCGVALVLANTVQRIISMFRKP
jgi:hypothetical protein